MRMQEQNAHKQEQRMKNTLQNTTLNILDSLKGEKYSFI